MRRKKSLPYIIFALGLLSAIFILPKSFARTEAIEHPPESIEESGPEITYIIEQVGEGDVFTKTIGRLGIGYSHALSIVEQIQDEYNLTRIRLGSEFKAIYEDGELKAITHDIPGDRIVIIEPSSDSFLARVEDITYETELHTAHFDINASLFLSGVEAGLSEGLIVRLANVFAWTIDFATQVQQGDSVEVLYERRYRDGEYAGTGQILAASFTNRGRQYKAFAFENDEGDITYYDEEGKSLVRQFLRAPLEYSRITSGYTYARFHPILHRNTPHRAIDYAAPTGTPIYAVADATVTFAGWSGGYGNFIKLRHNSTYGTNYAHLSRFAVSAGDRVRQGQVIGYVGSTGWSTGPHLHYEMTVNGQLVNPNEVELPAGDPVSDERRGEFEAIKELYSQKLGW